MVVQDLLKEVLRRGGDPRAIYVGIGNPEDRYAILECNGHWKVFFSEKGEELELRYFNTEGQACEYALHLLEADATIWSHAKPADGFE